jgi:hypothetical protein
MRASMCPSVTGMVPTKDGTDREDCANCRPALSISPIAMSQLSRTTEEKEVRTKFCAASSISPAMRLQAEPRLSAEKPAMSCRQPRIAWSCCM